MKNIKNKNLHNNTNNSSNHNCNDNCNNLDENSNIYIYEKNNIIITIKMT